MPLSQLEALDLDTNTWAAPDISGHGPSPRGQPAAAATTPTPGRPSRLMLFGGWDGKQRYNDLHALDTEAWRWERLGPLLEPVHISAAAGTPAPAEPQEASSLPDGALGLQPGDQASVWPCARADHSMVTWHYCDDGGCHAVNPCVVFVPLLWWQLPVRV